MKELIEKLVAVDNELNLAWDVLNSLVSRDAVLTYRRRMRDLETESVHLRGHIVNLVLKDFGYSFVEGLWVKIDEK